MKEIEYVQVTNRVKVSVAINFLGGVIPGAGFGITEGELLEIISTCRKVEERMKKLYTTADWE